MIRVGNMPMYWQKCQANMRVFSEQITTLNGEFEDSICQPVASEQQVQTIEQQLGLALPTGLRDFFLHATSKISWRWFLPENNEQWLPEIFREIFSGQLSVDLLELVALEQMRQEWIKEVFYHLDDEYDRIWQQKLVFMEVGNGDFLAIELADEHQGKVVYLSHDGDEMHGRYLADNFQDYLLRMSKLGFVGAECWQWFCFLEQDGINPSGEYAHLWRAVLGIDDI